MKIKAPKSDLRDAITSAAGALRGKELLDPLAYIMIKAGDGVAVVSAANQVFSIRETVDVEVAEEGSACLYGERLVRIVDAMNEGDVEIAFNQKTIMSSISGDGTKFTLGGIDPNHYPKLDAGSDPVVFTVIQGVLAEVFRKVSFAMASAKTRESLRSVHFDLADGCLSAVATSGAMLSTVSVNVDSQETCSFTVPADSVRALQKLLAKEGTVTLSVAKTAAVFSADRWQLRTSTFPEAYPAWRRVVPKDTKIEVTVDRALLAKAVSRAALASSGVDSSIDVKFKTDSVSVSARNGNVCSVVDVVKGESSEEFAVSLNASMFGSILAAVDDDKIVVRTVKEGDALAFSCSIPFVAVLMPLRVY